MTPITRSNARAATRPPLTGAFTALVTPFTADGAVDEDALRRLVRWQVLAGIDGLVPVGTTGEAPTLSPVERDRVIAITVETVAERASRGRVPVVAGTGTNDTTATIAATRRAAALGADAALVVAPYYNRPDGRMLEAHFRAIAIRLANTVHERACILRRCVIPPRDLTCERSVARAIELAHHRIDVNAIEIKPA